MSINQHQTPMLPFSSIPRLVLLPPIFYSHSTGTPFSHCVECDRAFSDETDYVVEKAFRRYPDFNLTDTIFEYAMCLECAGALAASLSRESVQRLGEYLSDRVNLEYRLGWLLQEEEPDPARWLAECMVTGKPADEFVEFQIIGYCRGSRLALSLYPYLIGETAVNEMVNLLSAETLQVMNDFGGRHFGLPPELKGLPRTRFMPVL